MNRVSAVSAIALILFAAGICQADSLVITYRSGKTQTIILDESSQSINSWQFVGGAMPQQQTIKPDEAPKPANEDRVRQEPTPQPVDDKKTTEKAPENKTGIRMKWNAKPIPE